MAEKKYRWYWFSTFLCRQFCRAFFKFRVYGLENIPSQGGFLLVSNHQSFLDPLFCGVYVKRALNFFARDTLFKNRFFRKVLTSVNAIPVRRGEADMSAIRAVIAKLKEQEGVCLFPEGTRTTDGRISAFKPGLGLLCRKGNAQVVPAVIDGAFEGWPRHKKLFKPFVPISVCYGKPVTAEEVSGMTDDEFAQMLTDRLRQMQSQLRIKQGKKPFEY